MKNILNSFAGSKVFAFALVIILGVPSLAHAEHKGKFTLETETHWGPATLPAGNYDFMLDSTSVPDSVIVRSENGKVAAIVISIWSSQDRIVEENGLALETRGGQTFVRDLYLSGINKEVHFAIPEIKEYIVARGNSKTTASAMATSVQ
jgi:hypothetical protein